MILPDRLKSAMEREGVGQSELARRCGLSSSMIGKLVRGEARGSAHVYEIARSLNTSAEFLSGDTDDFSIGASRVTPVAARPPTNPDLVELDEIDLRYGLGATYVDGHVSVERRQFSRSWLRNFTPAAPEHLFWAAGDGDSMEPIIRSGEIVLIDASQKTLRMSEGIWAVALGEIGMIKRIHYAGQGKLQLLSEKDSIPPIDVAEDELHLIGRVVAVVRKV